MSPEPTEARAASLLHYNDCAADSGAPCTCEPPLTTVEDVAAVLFACHEIEYIDADTGWACACDEDGYLTLPNEVDARKHQANSMVAAVRPLLAAEAREEIAEEFDRRYEEFVAKQSWEAARSAGYAARLTRTLRTSAEQSALRTTTPEHKGDQ